MMAEWQNVVSYMIPIDKTRATHASCVVRTLYPARVRRRTLCVVERCAVECVSTERCAVKRVERCAAKRCVVKGVKRCSVKHVER